MELTLTGESLSWQQVASWAADSQNTVAIDACVYERVAQNHQVMLNLLSEGKLLYGVNTGYGAHCTQKIADSDQHKLQERLILDHLVGVGEKSPECISRACALIRLNNLSLGYSGVSVELLKHFINFLNNGLSPVIPFKGSVGASGDLVPQSYLAASLIGHGDVYSNGSIELSSRAFKKKGLVPYTLKPKEGLALINGTSFMGAYAVFALQNAKKLLNQCEGTTAIAIEALTGDLRPYSDFVARAKNHPGVLQSAQNISGLLKDSKLARQKSYTAEEFSSQPLQERYSLRCAPQILGSLHDFIATAEQTINREINAASDNPLFDSTVAEGFSGGNFYGGHVVLMMDGLKNCLAHLADFVDRQIQVLADENFNNGLPARLRANEDPLQHSVKAMQIASTAIAAEAQQKSLPIGVFSRSTECHNQDKVSLATIAAQQALEITEFVSKSSALQLIIACQAVELRGLERMSTKTKQILQETRRLCPFIDRPQPLDRFIEAVADFILSKTKSD